MDVSTEHIEIVEGALGPKARILGHRIRVIDVVGWHEELGWSVDKILEEFPQLTRAEVYVALAYYWDHKDEIDAKKARDEAYVGEMMRRDPGRMQEVLRQRRSQVG
jgi:uncharacterized protein (DUF433 family)